MISVLKRNKDLKVIIVSKNTHLYWNLASVRAIIPGQIKDEAIFKPLSDALSRYPKESWELIIGTATAANLEEKAVEVAVSDGTTRKVAYDQLVMATGARSAAPNVPWKAADSYEDTVKILHDTAARVKNAQHIVVGGAGSTGVEVAGELGHEYGKTKEIILLCAADKILGGDSVAAAAAHELKKLNVTIKYGARVAETRTTPEGKTHVVLSTGEALSTDLYLPTTGLLPNTEYLPGRYLSADAGYRRVLVDEFLRVQDARDAWACGDVVSKPRAGFLITQKQAANVARNVELALAGREPAVAKDPPADIFACSVGRDRGAGRINSIRLPSFAVWLAKGRTLGMQRVQGYVDGSVA
ncbi:311080a9-3742-422b-8cab-454d94677c70 [Thermothielavioides terrestris]|uniref:311080a9-3742-422b-8cab-454d94677c70 n=1 Tax=Thermothielavioides terrestris TaxID=2587410 RepID=A0A3S4ASX9_9PEZI|nr:311080a9-3742-422b-8cab-454d94677c70 [Thermothielavioides terrestris]